MDIDLKPNLFEQGTRWDHYNELRDLFAEGVDILERIKIKMPADRLKLVKMKYALEMIEARLNFITDYTKGTSYGSKLRTAVDGDIDTLFRKMKLERSENAATTQQNAQDDDNDSPASYTTK